MKPVETKTCCPALNVAALLLIVAGEAGAQTYLPISASPDPIEQAPSNTLSLSQSVIRALNHEREADLQMLSTFDGKKRSTDRSSRSSRVLDQQGSWAVYGRLGLLNFRNELQSDDDTQFTWRKTGPRLGGKIYVGIHRRF